MQKWLCVQSVVQVNEVKRKREGEKEPLLFKIIVHHNNNSTNHQQQMIGLNSYLGASCRISNHRARMTLSEAPKSYCQTKQIFSWSGSDQCLINVWLRKKETLYVHMYMALGRDPRVSLPTPRFYRKGTPVVKPAGRREAKLFP